MWAILLPLLTSAVDPIRVCPTYSCHEAGVDWGDVCFKPVNDDYSFQICSDPLQPYCNLPPSASEPVKCSGLPERIVEPKYPGDHCTTNQECYSGSCVSNKCKGGTYASPCVSHIDCDVGTFCSSAGICEAQKGLQQVCYSDWECQNALA